jgi:hypothetical protein
MTEPTKAKTAKSLLDCFYLLCRVVAELADFGERREAVLATSIPERPGTFTTHFKDTMSTITYFLVKVQNPYCFFVLASSY